MRNSLLLTATVTPNVTSNVRLIDSALRLEQYQRAVDEWFAFASISGFELHIVETSGASPESLLSALPPAERHRVTFSNFVPDHALVSRGKGAIELAAIAAHARAHALFAEPGSLYKVTGRLTVSNARRCVDPLSYRQVRARMTLDRSYADTRLFGASSDIWPVLIEDLQNHIDDSSGVYFEHALAGFIAAKVAIRQAKLSRFATRPIFKGMSGTSGASYGELAERAQSFLVRPFEYLLASVAQKKQV